MTETEWLQADSFLALWRGYRWSKASPRKRRLFGCACARRLGDLLVDSRSLAAIEVSEQFADGLVDKAALTAARNRAARAVNAPERTVGNGVGQSMAASAAEMTAHATWSDAFVTAAVRATFALEQAGRCSKGDEDARQVLLLRDIFGNPFRPVALDASWLTSNVVGLARGIYENRAFDRLPILADALLEIGCDHADILAHCRQPGEHVRGCWVVDALLGKE
jgi:hypothetical protein